MYPEFVDFLGLINNDTGIQGKAFIFKMVHDKGAFECVLFVHVSAPAFVTCDPDVDVDPVDVLKIILNKHTLQELLAYEN